MHHPLHSFNSSALLSAKVNSFRFRSVLLLSSELCFASVFLKCPELSTRAHVELHLSYCQDCFPSQLCNIEKQEMYLACVSLRITVDCKLCDL